jgi:hypothetical protein
MFIIIQWHYIFKTSYLCESLQNVSFSTANIIKKAEVLYAGFELVTPVCTPLKAECAINKRVAEISYCFYLINCYALISLFHIKKTDYYTLTIVTPLYWHFVTPTCFGPQTAIFREYERYIFTVSSKNCILDVKFKTCQSNKVVIQCCE